MSAIARGDGSRSIERIRIELEPQPSRRIGLTEIEAWGTSIAPYPIAPGPAGNLVYRPSGKEYPKASASHSDRFGGTPEKSNDGKTVFDPNPMNRWTSYESSQASDWLEFDLGEPRTFGRLELAIYDDRGGVQAPESFAIEVWSDGKWVAVEDETHLPLKPAGSYESHEFEVSHRVSAQVTGQEWGERSDAMGRVITCRVRVDSGGFFGAVSSGGVLVCWPQRLGSLHDGLARL